MTLLFRSTFSRVSLFAVLSVGFLGGLSFLETPAVDKVLASESSSLAMTLVNPASDRSLSRAISYAELERKRAEMLTAQERRLQNDNLVEFRKNQEREFQLRKEEVMAQRKACNLQVNNFMKERRTQRENLRKSCMPMQSAVPGQVSARPANSSQAAELRKQRQQQTSECVARVKSFDTDTRVQTLTLRKSCYDTERGVLGLSTEAPIEF